MADPTGSIGARPDTDFSLMLKGGADFAARLHQLADARDKHDAALAQLKLGENVQAALDAARAQLADAGRMQAAAAKMLADAKRDAAAIRSDADRERATAAELRTRAEERERQTLAALDAARAAAARAEVKEQEFTDKIDWLKAALAAIR